MRPRAARTIENALRRFGFYRIAGVDEVGRGCLAGPVMAGAVDPRPGRHIPGLRDSKLLTPEERERLHVVITRSCCGWAVAAVEPGEIDRINIHQATLRAMRRGGAVAVAPARSRARRRLPHPRPADAPARRRARRRPLLGDRRRVDRRQGHARPAHGRPARRRSALRVRPPQGLRHRRTPGRRRPASATPPFTAGRSARRRSSTALDV